MINKTKLAIAMGLLLGAGASAHAISFNPDGTGPEANLADAQLFDWAPSSFLAKNGITAISNFQVNAFNGNNALDTTFQVYTHAKLATINDTNGDAIWSPVGKDYEITMILGFTERVTSVTGATATFEAVLSQPVFFQIFYDTAKNSNNLTGAGFNDGRLIASSTSLSPATGLFTVTDPAPQILDQNGTNNYGPTNGIGAAGVASDQRTVIGTGSNTDIILSQLAYDPTFFLNGVGGFDLTHFIQSIGQSLPFLGNDPSDCFTVQATAVGIGATAGASGCDAAHVDGLYSAQGAAPAGGYTPVVGDVNGQGIPAGQGALVGDFVAKADFNATFTAVQRVPEPASLSLMGIGLAAFGAARTRRDSKKQS